MKEDKEMVEFSEATIARIGAPPPFRNIPVYLEEEVIEYGEGDFELAPARYLFSQYEDERPLPACPNCGKKDAARQGSSSWAHSEMCCSSKCGLEFSEKLMAIPEWRDLRMAYLKSIGNLGDPYYTTSDQVFLRKEMDKILNSVKHRSARGPTILKGDDYVY